MDEQLRETLADNIRRLMGQRYLARASQARALAADANLSLSSVQRVLDCDTGASVDTVSAIARVFRLPPYKLLIKPEEAGYFIDAREVVGAQTKQRDTTHSPGHRGDKLRRD